jgi:hypothetical protein
MLVARARDPAESGVEELPEGVVGSLANALEPEYRLWGKTATPASRATLRGRDSFDEEFSNPGEGVRVADDVVKS